MLRRSFICGTVFSTLVMVGCASLRELIGLGVQRPRIELQGVQLVGLAGSVLDMKIALKVWNPNNFDLQLDRLTYQLEAAGLKLAGGQRHQVTEVLARESALISFPVRVEVSNVANLLSRIVSRREQVVAKVSATALFSSSLHPIQVSFSDERPITQLFD